MNLRNLVQFVFPRKLKKHMEMKTNQSYVGDVEDGDQVKLKFTMIILD